MCGDAGPYAVGEDLLSPPLESFGFELYPLKGIVLQILVELTEPD